MVGNSQASTIPVFCGKDCGGNACPLLATIDSGRITRIVDNPAAGRSLRGCERGFNLASELYSGERLRKPLIRTGERGTGSFREAGWDEALNLISRKLGEIRSEHGASAVLDLSGSGTTSALHATGPLLGRFLSLFGGRTAHESNYSFGAAGFVLPYVLGDEWNVSGFDAATMRHSEMIILWGANVLEARLGTEVNQRLLEAARRGAKIVVIDPRRSGTARRTDAWWLPCRPGTDAALMLAVLHVLLAEGLVNRSFIDAHSVGFDRLEKYVRGLEGSEARTPAWAEGICGLPATKIVRFAREYAAAKPAMLLPGYSIQRVYAGEETYRLTVALQIATGNFGQLGGSTGSLNNRLPTPLVGKLPVPRGASEHAVKVLRWPDAVREGRAGGYPTDIHAIYAVGGNYVNQGADVKKSIEAFKKADFAVCHELFMTPTARLCDVVLPAAHSLEKEDIGIPWLGNFLAYKPRASVPLEGVRSDFDILSALAERLDFGPSFTEGRDAEAWVQFFLDQSEVTDQAEFRRTGVYFGKEQERVGLADFTADPGMHPLGTPSGMVEIASESYARETGFPAIPSWQPPPRDPRYPLLLITPKSLHRTHSQGASFSAARARAAHALHMNADDAAARGLADGKKVRIFNDRGAARIVLRTSSEIAPGVVCLEEGVWFELDEGGEDAAGSANVFTATSGTAPGIANIMHGIGVEVEAAADTRVPGIRRSASDQPNSP